MGKRVLIRFVFSLWLLGFYVFRFLFGREKGLKGPPNPISFFYILLDIPILPEEEKQPFIFFLRDAHTYFLFVGLCRWNRRFCGSLECIVSLE